MVTTIAGQAAARIAGLGCYRPSTVLSSDLAAAKAGVDGDWIVSRTGIRERRVAQGHESVVAMASLAAAEAIADAGLDSGSARDTIDLVIVATSTAPTTIPSTAAQVAARLGLRQPAAFDLNTACAGFCHALACADSLIRAGASRGAVVVGADRSTDWLDWSDRETGPLFGDGAGAAVVLPAPRPGIGPVVWGSMGERAEAVRIAEDGHVLRQNGLAVYRWATSLAPVAREVCRRGGVAPEDLAAFVPHQANLRIIESLARQLGVGDAVIARDVCESGNTIAATIPIALARLKKAGDLPTGRPILLFGFGAGLAYAGQIVTL
jgi:3-oxoacyl-[acyl-carrier-protein] synthase III